MSLATTLLKSLGENAFDESYAQNIAEPHIVINASREVIVPEELRNIAVKMDKDIETVTFDCVRYWDDNDLSTFAIYLNYVLPDGEHGTYIPDEIVANEGEDVFHFDWKIKGNITRTSGTISFAITAIKTKVTEDGEIVIDKQWGSLPNSKCSIASGIGVSDIPAEEDDASVLAQISALLEKLNGYNIAESTYSLEFEQGALDPTNGSETSSTTRIRSDYMPLDVPKKIENIDLLNYLFWVRVYDESHNYLGTIVEKANAVCTMDNGSGAANWFHLSTEKIADYIPNAYYARIVIRRADNGAISPTDGKNAIKVYYANAKMEYEPNDLHFSYPIDETYKNYGMIKLPKNYTVNGDKVPLIVFCHGSADYRYLGVTSMTTNYNKFYNYLRDCGYAVCDFFGLSSKYYNVASANQWCIPLSNSCYDKGIQYVLDNFNVDPNNIFVGCKSLGGNEALNLYDNDRYNIKAVGMLAPQLNPLADAYGYTQKSREISADSMGVSDTLKNMLISEYYFKTSTDDHITESAEKRPALVEAFTENYDILARYNPFWTNLIMSKTDKIVNSFPLNVPSVGFTDFPAETDVIRIPHGKRALKIWAAIDEDTIDVDQCKFLVHALLNGGGNASIRLFPENTGKHHAVDTDANAPQTLGVTTKTGVYYETIPTAYYELELFFRDYISRSL